MVEDAAGEVVGHAGVEGAVLVLGEDVDIVLASSYIACFPRKFCEFGARGRRAQEFAASPFASRRTPGSM